MESIIKELWRGNIVPEDDCRIRSPEMKQVENNKMLFSAKRNRPKQRVDRAEYRRR